MAKDLFSVPVFFILFRETLEAAIIISVLLGLVESLVKKQPAATASAERTAVDNASHTSSEAKEGGVAELNESTERSEKRLVRRMRLQILFGALSGFAIALAIGVAFIVVFYTTTKDYWGQAEDVWEGVFSLIAAIIIFPVAITMLRMDRAKLKWKIKLRNAFEKRANEDKSSRFSKYALFFLPFVTVLREGLEAIIFVAGVSLGQPATSIPIAAIVGILCGFIIGAIIYLSASRTSLSIFLVVSTNFLLLIGAGLFSKAVGDFQTYKFVQLVGADVGESGDGPGSYEVEGNVWHLPYGNPENKTDGKGWSIFNAIFGWNNNATIGTILAYVFYWLAVVVVLVYMKWSEGRTKLFGRHSAAGLKRQERRSERALPTRSHSSDEKVPVA